MVDFLIVAAGGAVGAALRYAVMLLPMRDGITFPVKTLAVNVVGCAAIALIGVVMTHHAALSPKWGLFLKTGICGGFTTFSAFGYESAVLLSDGHPALAAVYIAASIGAGVGAVLVINLFGR